eukprot:m.414350 g.414350  ORF g.414350 m.414350 type:complete len:142 (+) comp56592_c0_seq5:4416-4841(+)
MRTSDCAESPSKRPIQRTTPQYLEWRMIRSPTLNANFGKGASSNSFVDESAKNRLSRLRWAIQEVEHFLLLFRLQKRTDLALSSSLTDTTGLLVMPFERVRSGCNNDGVQDLELSRKTLCVTWSRKPLGCCWPTNGRQHPT